MGSIQEGDKVFARLLSIDSAGHLDLMCRTQDCTSNFVSYSSRKMCLVDNGKDIVSAFNSVCNKTRVLYDKDVVLRIRDNSSLVLRDLNDR